SAGSAQKTTAGRAGGVGGGPASRLCRPFAVRDGRWSIIRGFYVYRGWFVSSSNSSSAAAAGLLHKKEQENHPASAGPDAFQLPTRSEAAGLGRAGMGERWPSETGVSPLRPACAAADSLTATGSAASFPVAMSRER